MVRYRNQEARGEGLCRRSGRSDRRLFVSRLFISTHTLEIKLVWATEGLDERQAISGENSLDDTRTVSILMRFCFVFFLERLTIFSPNGQSATWSLRTTTCHHVTSLARSESTPVSPDFGCLVIPLHRGGQRGSHCDKRLSRRMRVSRRCCTCASRTWTTSGAPQLGSLSRPPTNTLTQIVRLRDCCPQTKVLKVTAENVAEKLFL